MHSPMWIYEDYDASPFFFNIIMELMENKKSCRWGLRLELIKRNHGVINMNQVCGVFSSFSFQIVVCEVGIKGIVSITIFYIVLCRRKLWWKQQQCFLYSIITSLHIIVQKLDGSRFTLVSFKASTLQLLLHFYLGKFFCFRTCIRHACQHRLHLVQVNVGKGKPPSPCPLVPAASQHRAVFLH